MSLSSEFFLDGRSVLPLFSCLQLSPPERITLTHLSAVLNGRYNTCFFNVFRIWPWNWRKNGMFELLKGNSVNLSVLEKEDIQSSIAEWNNNSEFYGEYAPLTQDSQIE